MAGLAISAVSSRAQLTLNFSSTIGSTIQFNGTASSFQFNNSTFTGFGGIFNGTQWSVTSETPGGSGPATGLFGMFNNGPYSYGPINTVINGMDTNETANVIGGSGTMNINDGSGYFLTGNVNWMQVETDDSIGGLNALLNVNVTGLAYSGSNSDLATLVAEGPASLNVSFQFSPAEMLTQLTSGSSPFSTSYSGSVSVVPEPATAGCLLLGLGVLAFTRRFKQNGRS